MFAVPSLLAIISPDVEFTLTILESSLENEIFPKAYSGFKVNVIVVSLSTYKSIVVSSGITSVVTFSTVKFVYAVALANTLSPKYSTVTLYSPAGRLVCYCRLMLVFHFLDK